MAKPTIPKKKVKLHIPVVGIQYRVTPSTRRMMKSHAPFKVGLIREPDNNHDPNAVKVLIAEFFDIPYAGMHIGYVPRKVAGMIGPALDQGKMKIHEAWVSEWEAEDATAEMIVTLSAPAKFLQILENQLDEIGA